MFEGSNISLKTFSFSFKKKKNAITQSPTKGTCLADSFPFPFQNWEINMQGYEGSKTPLFDPTSLARFTSHYKGREKTLL